MGFAFVPVYISYLGLESYGLIGLFAVLQTWLGLLDMGMTPTITREMGRYKAGSHTDLSIRDLLRTVETIALVGSCGVVAIVLLLSSWIATNWLNPEELNVLVVGKALCLMGIVSGLRLIEGIYRSCLIGLQKQLALSIVVSALATIRGVGAILVLAFVSGDIITFFIWQAIISIASLIIMAICVYRIMPLIQRSSRFSKTALAEIYRYSLSATAIAALGFLISQSDKLKHHGSKL